MSTRSGDLDPAVTLQLLARAQGDTQTVDDLLNRRSGVLGLSGASSDIRDALGCETDARSRLAVEVYLWRLRKYLGAYLTLVGKPHAVIFTDTIGEGVPEVRWGACSGLEVFGVRLDPGRNWADSPLPADVSAPGSPVRVLCIATNEELAIARRSYATLTRKIASTEAFASAAQVHVT
jgi:acetate kinase